MSPNQSAHRLASLLDQLRTGPNLDLPTTAATSDDDVGEYPRDMIGYGGNPPQPRWPGGAKLALQFVINYEEGSERNILHGLFASSTVL